MLPTCAKQDATTSASDAEAPKQHHHHYRIPSGWEVPHSDGDGTVVVGGYDHPLFLFNCDPEDVWTTADARSRLRRSSGAMHAFLLAYQQLGVHLPLIIILPSCWS